MMGGREKAEYRMQNTEYRIQNTEYRIQKAEREDLAEMELKK